MTTLPNPDYEVIVYAVTIKFPPWIFGSNQEIGYYDSKELAARVYEAFQRHFINRIRGGVDVFLDRYSAEVIQIPSTGEWRLKRDPYSKIETEWDIETIRARIASLTEHAKGIKITIFNFDGSESMRGIFIEKPSSKRKVEQEEPPPPSEVPKTGPEEELLKLGFAPFNGKEELRKAYKEWSLKNHPDKYPEGPERKAADIRFRTMKNHYDELLKQKGWGMEC